MNGEKVLGGANGLCVWRERVREGGGRRKWAFPVRSSKELKVLATGGGGTSLFLEFGNCGGIVERSVKCFDAEEHGKPLRTPGMTARISSAIWSRDGPEDTMASEHQGPRFCRGVVLPNPAAKVTLKFYRNHVARCLLLEKS